MSNFLTWVGAILLIVAIYALIFLFVSGAYWVVAWSFDLPFEWKYSVGITVIWLLIVQLFRRNK